MSTSSGSPPSSTAAAFVQSAYFRLEMLADGVYAAIANDDHGAICNAGIVDLGGQTLVFDTFQIPNAAQDLRAAAETLLGRPVAYVVNSHWHGDHVHGNPVFVPGATIIATSGTRELMATRAAAEIVEDREGIGPYLADIEQQLAAETEEAKRAALAQRLGVNSEYAEALPSLEIVLPQMTFDERMTLHGTRRAAGLVTYGGGHTGSDGFLYLPEEHIAFLGDLLFVGVHPYLPDGDAEQWMRILERVEMLPIETAVPGHGAVGTLADSALVRRYIGDLLGMAREGISAGKSKEHVMQTSIPELYETWSYAGFFKTNMAFLYDLARQELD